MTIEEKVRELILKQDIAAGYDKNGHARQERVEKFTQAIFALIKPMSRERLKGIIRCVNFSPFEEAKMSKGKLCEIIGQRYPC